MLPTVTLCQKSKAFIYRLSGIYPLCIESPEYLSERGDHPRRSGELISGKCSPAGPPTTCREEFTRRRKLEPSELTARGLLYCGREGIVRAAPGEVYHGNGMRQSHRIREWDEGGRQGV
jgi:hypothetical protein